MQVHSLLRGRKLMIMMSHFAEGYATIIKVIKSPTAGRFVHGVLVMLGAVQ
jgi:hypothetical protein